MECFSAPPMVLRLSTSLGSFSLLSPLLPFMVCTQLTYWLFPSLAGLCRRYTRVLVVVFTCMGACLVSVHGSCFGSMQCAWVCGFLFVRDKFCKAFAPPPPFFSCFFSSPFKDQLHPLPVSFSVSSLNGDGIFMQMGA